MKIRNRLLGLVLCLCALVCILCVSASAADGHVHPVCAAEHQDIGDHTGEGGDLTWIEVTKESVINGDLPLESGKSSYLGDNIEVKSAITISGTVNLCLNGHSITSERSVNSIIVKQSVTFTLTDCKGIGTIPNFNIAIWHGGLSLIVSKQHEKAATPCEPVMMSLPNFIFG